MHMNDISALDNNIYGGFKLLLLKLQAVGII